MKCVIPAAGKGTRLYPITEDIPKALVEVGGKPILERIILQLKPFFKEFIVIVGYKKEKVIEHFGEGKILGVHIHYSEQKELLGTAHAILQAEPFLKGESSFIMVFADTFFDAKTLHKIIDTKADGVIGVTKVEDPKRFGVVELDDSGRVIGLVEKPEIPSSDLAIMGIYKLPIQIFDAIRKIPLSKRGEYELPDAVRLLIKEGQSWKTVEIPKASDIGTLEQLKQAQASLK